MAFDVPKYLERIGFEDEPNVSFKCLTQLQACHQLTVPFENLDVFTGTKKILNIDVLYNKIVLERRGGWCHELNGLFSWLLRHIGFDVILVSCAHYYKHRKVFNQVPFDHMALIVNIDGIQYLVDVGYGIVDQHFEPLPMSTNVTYEQVIIMNLLLLHLLRFFEFLKHIMIQNS